GPQDVGQQAVHGPITAPYHVARTGSSQGDTGLPKERVTPRSADQLHTGLAAAIGIMAAKSVLFAVGPNPLTILVALVTGHHQHSADRITAAYSLQQVDRAHYIGCIGIRRRSVGLAYQRLCSQVQDDLRAEALEYSSQAPGITHVGQFTGHH